jgi:formylglycine-generating enzyme
MHHVQTFKDNRFTFTMRHVEGGTFDMGGKDDDIQAYYDEKPIHSVFVSNFWIGEYPVTQALWAIIMHDTKMSDPSNFKGDNHPVESVSWEDITNIFLPKLNEMTHDLRPKGSFYRLPTEVEWEFAAKGGKDWANAPFKYAGSNKLNEVGWYYGDKSHSETKPVGLKSPNFLGLYDMSGNVYECCEDQWHSTYEGAPNDSCVWLNNTQEGSDQRVARGGDWGTNDRYCRSTSRNDISSSFRSIYVGFRLVYVFPSN